MQNKSTYLIIGLGKFGQGFYQRLLREGVKAKNIYLVDAIKETVVKAGTDGIDNVFISNVSSISDLDSIVPLDYIDNIVIGTSDLEDSVSIVSSIQKNKDLADANVYVKSRNEIHSLILQALGIPKSNIVIPEAEIGSRTAFRSLFNQAEVVDIGKNFSLFTVELKNEKFINQTVEELVRFWERVNGSRRWNIVLINEANGNQKFPNKNDFIKKGDRIIFCCIKTEIIKIYDFFN